MVYDPFARGPLPVGVVSVELGARADRRHVELWFPAVDAHRGEDLDPAIADRYAFARILPPVMQRAVRDATPRIGSYPLVVFSHGYLGHRRQSTFLCTHLASHGYVVAAPDHAGATAADLAIELAGGPRRIRFHDGLDRRLADVACVLDGLLEGQRAPWARAIDRARVALVGHSLGGWTALAMTARDPRIAAVVALAPAGGGTLNRGAELAARIDWAWSRVVPTLLVAATDDPISPASAVSELHDLVRAPRRLLTLAGMGHHHFVDDGERAHELFRTLPALAGVLELAAPMQPAATLAGFELGELAVRGAAVVELDTFLKDHEEARRLRARFGEALADRGVAAEIR